jgi:hypothetical protein
MRSAHFIIANELCGIDEEMAVIRLIAVEEEPVVRALSGSS